MKLHSTYHSQKGLVGLYLVIIVLLLSIGIASSVAFTIVAQLKIVRNNIASAQAYYASESGVEDALLRLRTGLTIPSPGSYPTFAVGTAVAEPDISVPVGGTRTITVKGDDTNRIRRTEAVYTISTTAAGFFYGAQMGDGGLLMENSSKVVGNVFSNGDVVMTSPIAEITGTVQVAGAGNKIEDAKNVGGDAFADVCIDSDITGVLHTNTDTGCTYSSLTTSGLPVTPVALPISCCGAGTDVDSWKNDAAAGGSRGDYTLSSGTDSLGPIKVVGDLNIKNTGKLEVTGTIWVTGTVVIENSAEVFLDSGYGSTSGVIISDALITLDNFSVSSGSGSAGSYLMYLSTYVSASSIDPAIVHRRFAVADILYTTDGWVHFENNADLRELIGYGVRLANSAEVTYDSGLASTVFSSGPSGGWVITSWKEIE